MTNSKLTHWIKAADARRVCVAAFAMPTSIKAFVADHRQRNVSTSAQPAFHRTVPGEAEARLTADLTTDHRTAFSIGAPGQSMPRYIPSVTPAMKLAKMLVVALVMIAGILTVDLLILWVAAGNFIERFPF